MPGSDSPSRTDRPWGLGGRAEPIDPDLLPSDPSEPSSTHHPLHIRRVRQRDVLVCVAVGGFVGTLARYGATEMWPTSTHGFPLTTFLINTSGAFALGLLLTVILEHFGQARRLQPLLCTGFLGSWTTMSGFALECDALAVHGDVALSASYAVATLSIGLMAAWTGMSLGRALAMRVQP